MEEKKPLCDVAVIGIGVMGANLARNFANHGRRVAIYDREPVTTIGLAARGPEAAFAPCDSVDSLRLLRRSSVCWRIDPILRTAGTTSVTASSSCGNSVPHSP